MSDEERSSSDRLPRAAGLGVRLLVVAAVVHFLVLPQIGGTRRALTLLSQFNPLVLLAALGLEAAALLAYAQLTRALLVGGPRPSLWAMVRIVLASTSISHVVPGGAAAGGALQYRLLVRHGVGSARASFALATQSLGSAGVLNALLWLGLVASIPATGFQPIYATAAAVGAVAIGTLTAGVVLLTRGRVRTISIVARLASRLPKVDPDRVREALGRAADQLAVLLEDRRRLAAAMAWASANWIADAGVLWLFAAVFGHRPGVVGLVVAYGLANVVAAVPLTPGGLGVMETTLVLTLVGFGTPRAVASLAVAAYRLIQFWLPIPVGAAAWASLTGRRGTPIIAMAADASAEDDESDR